MSIKYVFLILFSYSMNFAVANISYDDNGNMLQDAEGNHYQYDAKDQLIDFLPKDKINEYMHYDAENMRDGYVVKGEHLGFIYTDDDLVNTTEPQVKKKSAYLLREVRYIDDLNQANQANRSTQYFVKGNKNTTSILLLSNSGITNFYHYDPYGKRRRINTQQSNSDQIKQTALNHNVIDDNPLGYNGEYQYIFSGLIYLRARFYNPVIQRFIQRDTYNLLNRYSAFNDNPISNIDRNGHNATSFLSGVQDFFGSNVSQYAWNSLFTLSGLAEIALSGFNPWALIPGVANLIAGTTGIVNALTFNHGGGSAIANDIELISYGVGALSSLSFAQRAARVRFGIGAKSISDLVENDTLLIDLDGTVWKAIKNNSGNVLKTNNMRYEVNMNKNILDQIEKAQNNGVNIKILTAGKWDKNSINAQFSTEKIQLGKDKNIFNGADISKIAYKDLGGKYRWARAQSWYGNGKKIYMLDDRYFKQGFAFGPNNYIKPLWNT
ncbi:RHS repeat-associated core domain-containing protein [Cysteiniphilum litorale]|uniref:RHS repeat-associated core domain-containing protein n=1 Tax=Cysteiniphilum litorale TaxID=2056700 RepID=UPI003F885490